MSINSSSPTWESDKMLNVYIYDYCIKRNYKEAARAFYIEAKVPQDQQVPINAREGFLYEWWTVFWDIFSARANRSGSQEALSYVDIQHDKSQQFAQWRKMQMMMAQNNNFPQTPGGGNTQPVAASEVPQSPIANFPIDAENGRFGHQNGMNTATASQILGFCSSMFLAQLGHKTIDQITEIERISVLTDMKNRRVFGYPELNDPAIRAQFMASRCYLSLTQKIHSFSSQQGFVIPQVANQLVRPILDPLSTDIDANVSKRMRTMDSPMMAQSVTPRDSPIIAQAAPVPASRSGSNGALPVASPNSPWALPGFTNLPMQQQQQILSRHQLLERNRQALYAVNQHLNSANLAENQDAMHFHAKNLMKQQHQLFVQQHSAGASNTSKPVSRKKAPSSSNSPMLSRQPVMKREVATPVASSEFNPNPESHEMSNASLEELENFWAMASNAQNLTAWAAQPQAEDLTSMIQDDFFDIKGKEDVAQTTKDLRSINNESVEPILIAKTVNDSNDSSLEPVGTLVGHTNKVTACAIDRNSLILASIGNDRMLILWDVSQTGLSAVPQIHKEEKHFSKNVCAARFLKITGFFNSGATDAFLLSENIPILLATCGYDKCVTITNINCEKSVSGKAQVSSISKAITFCGHQRSVTSVDFCPYAFFSSKSIYGMNFFVGSLDVEGELIIWDAWTGKEFLIAKLPFLGKSYDAASNPLRFKPMGGETSDKCDIAAAFGKSIYYISVNVIMESEIELQENIIPISTPHVKNITNLDWSKDGRWLVTSSEDMAVVWDAHSMSNSVASRELASPFFEVCKIPSHSCKISFCTFLEPQIPLASEDDQGENGPPLVIFGEYQALHIWKIIKGTGSSVSPVRVTSIPNCQNGVVSCIDTCHDESFENPTLLVASSSGGVKNNLKLWKMHI